MIRILAWMVRRIGVLGLLLVGTFVVYAANHWLVSELAARRDALPDPTELRARAEQARDTARQIEAQLDASVEARIAHESERMRIDARFGELETQMAASRIAIDEAVTEARGLRAQIESRARYTRDLWATRVAEACTDGPWYRPLQNAARRAACDQAREGRDAALRQLDVWRETQQAGVDAARDRAASLESGIRDQLHERVQLAPEADAIRRELVELDARAERLRAEKDAQLDEVLRWERAADEAMRQHERLESWVLERWHESWKKILLVLILLQLSPYFLRALNYWILMSVVQREVPLRVLTADPRGTLASHDAERTLTVDVPEGSTLYARSSSVRPLTTGAARTRALYRWRRPLVSLAADLVLLTEVEGSAERRVQVTLSPAGRDAADRYVARIDLENHPGLVVHPRHIVALLGDLDVDSTFRLRSTHAWATGKLRFITVRGTGSVFLEGVGDVRTETLEGDARHEAVWSIIAFDGRLDYRAWRTELFVPYLLHGERLVEVQLEGEGLFVWQKCEFSKTRSPGEWVLGSFWSALGRLLGF